MSTLHSEWKRHLELATDFIPDTARYSLLLLRGNDGLALRALLIYTISSESMIQNLNFAV